MKRFASTRSDRRASQPSLPAQWRVGSIDEDGIRYGFTTQALIASTIAIAPAIVTIQSIAIRHGRGRRYVSRSTGFRDRRAGAVSTAAAAGSAAASYGVGSSPAGGGGAGRAAALPWLPASTSA